MDETEVIVRTEPISDPQESEQTGSDSERVETVADEILEEVKECRNRLNQQETALQSLQSDGGPVKQQQIAELQTILENTREEMRNLFREWKESQRQTPNLNPNQAQAGPEADTSQSTPSISETEVIVIDPEEAASPEERTVPSSKKRKRYRI